MVVVYFTDVFKKRFWSVRPSERAIKKLPTTFDIISKTLTTMYFFALPMYRKSNLSSIDHLVYAQRLELANQFAQRKVSTT